MPSDDHQLQIEILTRDQPQAYQNSVVIRELESQKFYIEETRVVAEPQLDSSLVITYTNGDLKGVELTVPVYNFHTNSGQAVMVSSDAGEFTASFT